MPASFSVFCGLVKTALSPSSGQEFDRRRPDHAEYGAGARGGEMKFVTRRAVAEIGIEPVEGRGRKPAPAAIMSGVTRDIKAVTINLLAIFEQPADPAK